MNAQRNQYGALLLNMGGPDSIDGVEEYIYRLLVHDKVIQPIPEDQVSQQTMKHKLAIWVSKLK